MGSRLRRFKNDPDWPHNVVRGVVLSERHPYMFSCGDDKQVKCWDLEYNKVVRHYYGHTAGVYAIALTRLST